MQPVVGPPVDHVRQPAGRLGLEPLAQIFVVRLKVAVGTGHQAVEQQVVVAARDHDPDGLPGERCHLDTSGGPDHFGGERALHILVAEGACDRDHHVRRVSREAPRIVRVGQPRGHPWGEPRRPDAIGQDVGVEEVLLDKLPQRRRELILALDDDRRVRDRQSQRVTEEGRDREPVRDAADHCGLSAGLHVTEERPVHTDGSHRDEQDGDRSQERRCPPTSDDKAAFPRFQ